MKIKQSLRGLIISRDNLGTLTFLYVLIFLILNNVTFILNLSFIIKVILPFIIVILSILHKYLFMYYILDKNTIYAKSGIIFKNEEYTPFEKITSINSNQTIIHRILNCYILRIDTNDTGNEFSKLIISEENYNLIKSAYNNYKQGLSHKIDLNISENQKESIYEYIISRNSLIKFAFSKINIFAFFIIIGAFYKVISNIFDDDKIFDTITSFNYSNLGILIAVVIIILFLIIIALVIKDTLKFYNYTLKKYKDHFEISYGALTQQNYTIQNKSIHGIRIKQTILGRIFKINEIHVISAGYGVDSEEDNEAYFALAVENDELDEFIKSTLPQFASFKKEYKPNIKSFTPSLFTTILFFSFILFIINIFISIHVIIFILVLSLVLLINIISLYFKNKYNTFAFDSNNIYFQHAALDGLNFTTYKYIIEQDTLLKVEMDCYPLQKFFKVSDVEINIHTDDSGIAKLELENYDEDLYEIIKQYLIYNK